MNNSDFIQNSDEQELLALVAMGDQHAFSILYHRYKQQVYNVGWTYTEDTNLAEDILQDVFIIIWKNRESLSQIQNAGAYFYTIAKNRAVRVLGQLANRQRYAYDALPLQATYQPDHTKELSESEMMGFIQKALKQLPVQQRRAFELSRMQGLTRAEAAAQMQISKATFSVHLTIAIKRVRAYLSYQLEFWLLFFLIKSLFFRNL